MADELTTTSGVRGTAGINLILGIWLFVSPWVYGAYTIGNAWNSWLVGVLVAIFAAFRISRPAIRGLSWVNLVLGAWTFFSPWIYGYTAQSGRFINSVCVGALMFIMACYGAFTHSRTVTTQSTR
jgi:hypothetical protein